MFSIQTINPNIFLICFKSLDYKRRVLAGRLWLFDVVLFSIKIFDGYTPPIKMVFDNETFWIQMHHLPLVYLNIARGDQIGRSIGRVLDCVVQDFGASKDRTLRV